MIDMELTKSMFKSYAGINELIIKHPPGILTIEIAQQILDNQEEIKMLKNIITDLKQSVKRAESIIN
jgi:hypothetical protein